MARSTYDVPQPFGRIVARRTAAAWLVCAVAGAWIAPAALAQSAGAPIVIPGNGEQNPADLARMTALATSSTTSSTNSNGARTPSPQLRATVAPSASSPATDRFFALANANGAIVIPGTGETPESGAPALVAAPQMHANAAYPANSTNNAGLTRINMMPALAASQVVPVVVTSTPARAYAGAVRPVNAAPPAVMPAATPASGIEIDSLASRGEPPELGASAPVHGAAQNPAHNPAHNAASTPAARVAAAPVSPVSPLAAAPNQAQALAQAAQREQAVQALQRLQTTQAAAAAAQSAAQSAAQLAAQTAAQANAQSIQSVQAAAANQAAQAAQAAQPVPAGQEDGELIHAAALDYLKQQVNGLPGKVELSVAAAFPRGLAACATLQPFMPNGARLWGRTTVAVRCTSGHPWTVWLQAKVSVHATYYVATRGMMPGEVITEADMAGRDGDLTMLPTTIITDPSQAIGSVTLMRVGAGLPLRQDMLKNAASVTAGTMVRVVAEGNGFSISSEGSALANATPGQPVKVRTSTGQILMGIVKDSSTVQIQM